MSIWDDGKLWKIFRAHLLAQELTMVEIAADLGVTKNTCIGKLRRARRLEPSLPNPPLPKKYVHKPKTKTKPRRPRAYRPTTVSTVAAAPQWAKREPIVPRPTAAGRKFLHKSLMELGGLDCRWPHGEGPYTFCGQAVRDFGEPYCPNHARVSQRWPSTEG